MTADNAHASSSSDFDSDEVRFGFLHSFYATFSLPQDFDKPQQRKVARKLCTEFNADFKFAAFGDSTADVDNKIVTQLKKQARGSENANSLDERIAQRRRMRQVRFSTFVCR